MEMSLIKDLSEIRKEFPVLDKVVYLDNAATSLTPEPVLKELIEYNRNYRANIERGVHHLSKIATHRYKDAHLKVAELLGAEEEEIVFLKNTTEAINTVARGLDIKKGENIVCSSMSHHSNILPWQRIRDQKDINLKFANPKKGTVDEKEIKKLINEDTKLVAISHASNVTGSLNPIKSISNYCEEKGAYFLIDAAQTAAHTPIDVSEIRCDFLCASGHKMLAPTGTGLLYVKKEHYDELEPLSLGGGHVREVTLSNYSTKDGYEGLEAGTPNIGGGIALGKAADYLREIGLNKIRDHEKKLTNYLLRQLTEINEIEVVYPEVERVGVVSFYIEEIDAHTLAQLLDQENVIVRSGDHCSQPLLRQLGYDKLVRVSLSFYNTLEDINKLIGSMEDILRG
ncbi:MAG: Selenocysteine lyase/Cysteine desulfurase CsdA [Candidatus Methanohalarchaeum thermophilum]|uniref:cysteine desulfurase n=1 Tax=Methanohalarchaeum thermophilum TaxID=1903181 RepID=A0A1Q6DWA2_METT1|nr:MAG: Selenocysteine lyase/Cysteine desulfurase CsdA [Candidatus Methanohalarchaeum thermophilum]